MRLSESEGRGTVEEEKEKKEEKIPHMCESIGHRPLRGHYPAPSLNFKHNLPKQGTGTADHLTLLRLFCVCYAYGGRGCSRSVLSSKCSKFPIPSSRCTWPAFDARVDSHSVASFGDGAFGTFVASRRYLVDVMSFWTRNTSIAIA